MYNKIFINDDVAEHAKFNDGTSIKRQLHLKLEPLRGPHQDREIDLMLNHNKPIASLIYPSKQLSNYIQTWVPEFESYIYYKQENKHLFDMLLRCKKMYMQNKISWDTYTIRFGRLLGYSKNAIRYFLHATDFSEIVRKNSCQKEKQTA